MRQVLQELGSGQTIVAEVPEPATPQGSLRILTRRSLISAGTERMLVEFGRAGWVERARQQPERVRQVLDKLRTDGVAATLEAVRGKLDQTLPLGYCNVGEVDAGVDVSGFSTGDRVVSNGPHAEVVAVPVNLCARIPAAVSDDAAAFAVLGAIGLQGVRLAAPTLGESFVVTGLGLIGLITVQLLRANGCRVLGIDPDPSRTALARQFGALTVDLGRGEDPLAAAADFTRGHGVDGVLISAATKSDEPVSQAARMCRKRGRIVLVGVTGLQLNRADFYGKELTFQVSCSYGPGRYDPDYEQGGRDYPFGFVRWTEQRNFEAVLELMASNRLDVLPLITHRFALADALRAYDLLAADREPYLGVLLEYPVRAVGTPAARTIQLTPTRPAAAADAVVAVVGAGNYAGRTLLPALARSGARLFGIASRGGVTAAHLGRKYGFSEVTTDAAALIANPRVTTVVVATRHDTHATFVKQALIAGKHVFVEKPLAITAAELAEIESAWKGAAGERGPLLMVGFNRRFAPQVVRMKALLQAAPGPKSLVVTVNAGAVPADHWTQTIAVGGGRIIGEGCHFIDLLRFLAGAAIVNWDLAMAGGATAAGARDGPVTITLTFADGSTGTLHYFSNGHASFPKERIEAFCSGRILQLDNFRRLRGYGWSGFTAMDLWRQNKGQSACVAAFVAAIREGRDSPIPVDQLLEVSRITVALGEAARR
jgi:predicted dehydrogenase/threonine dehydrogenase-like Zn-dependent dehydrogenase